MRTFIVTALASFFFAYTTNAQTIVCIADEGICEMVDARGAVIFQAPIYTGAYDRPKMAQGDLRMPWGKYVAQGHIFTHAYLGKSLQVNYPNAYDRFFGHTGSDILIHPADSAAGAPSAGCFTIYGSRCEQVIQAVANGVPVYAFPCRMTRDAVTLLQEMSDAKYGAFINLLHAEYLQLYKTEKCPSKGNPLVFQSTFTLKKEDPESFQVDSVLGLAVVQLTTNTGKVNLSFIGIGSVPIEQILFTTVDDAVTGAHSRRSRMQFTCEIPNAFFDSITLKSHRTGKVFASIERLHGNRFRGDISLEEIEGIYFGSIMNQQSNIGFSRAIVLAQTTEQPVPTAMVVTLATAQQVTKITRAFEGDSAVSGLLAGSSIQIPLIKKEGRFWKSSDGYVIYEAPKDMGHILAITFVVGNQERRFVRCSGEAFLFREEKI